MRCCFDINLFRSFSDVVSAFYYHNSWEKKVNDNQLESEDLSLYDQRDKMS